MFELKGTVTADGKRAPGVDVNATVNGDTYTTETGKRGGFKLNVELPGKPGEYELGVNAGQKPYRGVSDSVRFHVEADRGIRLETSRDAEMNATKGVKTVKLVNTGQVALEDLDVDAELSCRKCSLDYAPMKIERLEPGSSTLIDLRFDVPESREMIRGTISVAGRETKASRNFAVIIETPEQENVTSEPEESATPVFTGFSFQMPSVQIGKNYLVVLNVLTLIAISAVFFYFRRDSGESDLERLENLRDLAVE